MSSDLNHLQQPDLFGLSTSETEGVCKAVDAMRDKDILPLTREERIGITLAEDRIRDERKRRNGLQFPKDAPRNDSLLQLTDEVSTAWRKEVGQVLKRK